jgi:hypothetical protein
MSSGNFFFNKIRNYIKFYNKSKKIKFNLNLLFIQMYFENFLIIPI